MNQFDAALNERLAAIREQDLYRELRRIDSPQSPHIEVNGKRLLNFSSNDYLGLANEPEMKQAAIRAVEQFGAGAGASRLICGSLAPHHELEDSLADFKGVEAALSFSSGYTAAVGAVGTLVGKEDVIVIDKLVHASIVDAARLSGAKLRIFSHNDLGDLQRILEWARQSGIQRNVLIVTESVFSMDGDCAPLAEIVRLKNGFGAWLMVDEAHATGIYGKNGRGLADELGITGEIEVQMGTLGKALGASGGYICGSRALINFLVNRARSFIFSTAPVPAAAAAASAGIHFVQSAAGEARRNTLWRRVRDFRSAAGIMDSAFQSAINPIIIGDEAETVKAAAALMSRGIFVPAIRYPTVARGQARLRVTITASHTDADIEKLAEAMRQFRNRES